MIDQPKPDRQDGDAPSEAAMRAAVELEISHCIGSITTRGLAQHLDKIAASLPTPDAAEAARLLRGWAKAYRDTPEHRFPSDPHAEFFPVDLERAAELLSATLKPAPDAVREALRKIIDRLDGPFSSAIYDARQIAEAALSALVPPADGAPLQEYANLIRREAKWIIEAVATKEDSLSLADVDTEELMNAANFLDRYCHNGNASPSGRAAEPDFETAAIALGFQIRPQDGKWWHPNQQHFVKSHDTAGDIFDWYFGKGWGEGAAEPEQVGEIQRQFYEWWEANQVDPAHGMITQNCALATWHGAYNKYVRGTPRATPPVRGDREAIARIIDPNAFRGAYLSTIRTPSKDKAFAKADAILSLHVQPAAGERHG